MTGLIVSFVLAFIALVALVAWLKGDDDDFPRYPRGA